jgi:DNA primase
MDVLGVDCDPPPGGAQRTHRRGKYRAHDHVDDELEAETDADTNAEQATACRTLVNMPLNFQLQGLDASHPYLKERGFTEQTIAHFGLGYCARGLMQGRVAIPLHDEQGQLVGYAGRIVDDSLIDEDHPKYLFPSTREREGKRYEFRKSLLVYHDQGIPDNQPELIVVEGFASVWWLWQLGYRNVVALMGSDCSVEQAKLIIAKVPPQGRIYLLPDSDNAGHRCAQSMLYQLAAQRWVHWVKLGKDGQPTDCSANQLQSLLKS